MDYYTIDLWQDESIWSWAGYARDWGHAEECARHELNRDWYCEYQSWEDLAFDMGGVSCRVEPGRDVRAKNEALNMLETLQGVRQWFEGTTEGEPFPEALIEKIWAQINQIQGTST